ncbi:MAG: hypothetical protein ABF261_08210 [Candidatus Arcticimaribacter sp.]
MKVFLANNCGLGDYILMNGATRYIAAQPDVEHVDLLCLSDHNKFMNVKWMYRDNPNITVHGEPCNGFGCDVQRRKIKKRGKAFKNSEHRVFAWEESIWRENMLRFGLDPDEKNCWPELFYALHQAPFSARHEYFYVERDRAKEEELFEKLNLPPKYALCIDQACILNFNFTPDTNLPVFKPSDKSDIVSGCSETIFDWMAVVERASEVHTIDTSWLHLLKSMKLEQPKYYYHYRDTTVAINIRTSKYINDEYDNGWQIIDDKSVLDSLKQNNL